MGFSLEDTVFVSDEKADELLPNNAHPGDLIFTQRGTLGQIGIVPADCHYRRLVISQSQMKMTVDPFLTDPRFLFYFFSAPETISLIDAKAIRAGVPHINLDMLRSFEVPNPPLPIQRRIVSILSAYDDLIENNRKRIAILEEMARRLYREWFVHFRYPGHESVPLEDSALGQIPQGWEVLPFDSAILLQRGFDLPKGERIPGAVPIYAATGINGHHHVAKVKAPGVITGRSGSIGTVMLAWNDFWPLNTTLWVKDFRRINPFLAFFLLKEMGLSQYNAGAAVPTLNRNDLARINTLVPPIKIQDAFADQAGSQLRLADNLVRQNDVLRRTRDLLLPRLMSGQLSVEAAEAAIL